MSIIDSLQCVIDARMIPPPALAEWGGKCPPTAG